MNRVIAPALATVLLGGLLSASPSSAEPAPAERGRTTVPASPAQDPVVGMIVQLTDDADARAVQAAAERLDADLQDAVRTTVAPDVLALTTPEVMSPQDAERTAARLERRSDVEWAEPNRLRRTFGASPVRPNDPGFPQQNHLWDARGRGGAVAGSGVRTWPDGGYSTKAPAFWRAAGTRGAQSVVVAVLDTGYRPHADLSGNLVAGQDFISDPWAARDSDGRDADASDPGDWCPEEEGAEESSWHGTHVAGIVAAQADNGAGVAGVAPGVRVMPVRVIGRCGGTDADIVAGIRWAATQPRVKVINLSLGGNQPTCPRSYRDAVAAARRAGAVVVAAAGNSARNAAGVAPANCPGVLAVGATSPYGDRAAYSNYGGVVDLMAAGGDRSWAQDSSQAEVAPNMILSTSNSGSQGPVADNYVFMEGTSMAAPMVSAAAALFASTGVSNVSQLETAVRSAVTPFPSSSNPDFVRCSTSACGTGILDLSALPVLVRPSVSGTAASGRALQVSVPRWLKTPSSVAYRWYVDGRATKVTSRRYVVRAVDAGRVVSVRVTARRAGFRVTTVAQSRRVAKLRSAATLSVSRKATTRTRLAARVRVRASGLYPTGTVQVLDGTRRIRTVRLTSSARGSVSVRLPRLRKGTHRLQVRYLGSGQVSADVSSRVTVRVR